MKFVTLTIITASENEDRVKAIAHKAGANGATIVQARGSNSNKEKKSFFSLTFEGSQVVMLFVLEEKLSKSVLKALHKEITKKDLDCLAFSSSVANIVGLDRTLIKQFTEVIKKEDDL
jgi:ribosomal protein L11 methylase PrmA